MPKITLRDVANQAGVSVTTVSNVVRGWPYISDETRLKVEQAIRELGYHPHPFAQGLRTGRTQVIGFIVPDLANPHFASMVSTVEDIAREHGYSVLVFNTHEDVKREEECVRQAINGWVDGLMLVQTGQRLRVLPLLEDSSFPFVPLARVPANYQGASCSVDNFHAAGLIMNYLYNLGHRRIAHLGGPSYALAARDRIEGYLRACETLGLKYCRVMTPDGHWAAEDGYRAMLALLDEGGERPTAVFASNDLMAIGASRAIWSRGLRIPQDISLVGVDDIEVSKYTNPPLTTIRQPVDKMARAGIEMLLDMILDHDASGEPLSLQPELIVRESAAPLQKEDECPNHYSE